MKRNERETTVPLGENEAWKYPKIREEHTDQENACRSRLKPQTLNSSVGKSSMKSESCAIEGGENADFIENVQVRLPP